MVRKLIHFVFKKQRKIVLLILLFLSSFSLPLKIHAGIRKPFQWNINPYFFYQSHLYFDGNNRYSENYSGFGIQGSYRAFSWLSLGIFAETGGLHSVKRSTSSDYEDFFPEKSESREMNRLGAELEFTFFTSPENIFYLGLGSGYLWLGELNYLDSAGAKSIAKNSSRDMLFFEVSLGDRFLLFPSTILSLKVSFGSDLKKISSPLQNINNQSKKMTHYWIHLSLGFGFLF